MASPFKDIMRAGVSGLATTMAQMMNPAPAKEQPAKDDSGLTVQPHASRKYRPYRRVTKYHRVGPLHRQIAVKVMAHESWPVMQTFYEHHFLHATKGWRIYTGGPSMRMPFAPPANSARLSFYGGLRARRKSALEAQVKEKVEAMLRDKQAQERAA